VCATGKSAEEMLAILKRRLQIDARNRATRSRRAAAANHADSFGKVVDRMSAITTHVIGYRSGQARSGHCRAPRETRRRRLARGAGHGSTPEWASRRSACAKLAPCSWVEIAAGVTDADGRCRDLAADAPSRRLPAHLRHRQLLQAPWAAPVFTRRFPSPSPASGEAHYHLAPPAQRQQLHHLYRGS
jgi:hypothetical protein